jgi:hypothetical protein
MNRLHSILVLTGLPLLVIGCNGDKVDPVDTALDQTELPLNDAPVITLYEPIAGTQYSWNDDIKVSARVSDDDSATSLSVYIESDIDQGIGSAVLSSDGSLETTISGLSAGTHTLLITVTDPSGLEDQVSVTVTVLDNQAPTNPQVTIRPSNADSNDDLEAAITVASTDPDGDAVTYLWSWEVNGEDAGISDDFVPASETAEGDVWTVFAVATDGNLDSERVQASISIGQLGPDIDITLQPSAAYVDSSLSCYWTATDGSYSVESYAEWLVNGTNRGDGSDPLYDAFVAGDTVTCQVTASSDLGMSVATAAVNIQNSPPEITGIGVTPSVAYTETDLTCVPTVTDLDLEGDPKMLEKLGVTYQWYVEEAGSGVANPIEGADGTGVTLDHSLFSKHDQISCEAQADDGEDLSTKRASGQIVVLNSAPTAPELFLTLDTVAVGETVDCRLGTPSNDADGDTLVYVYEWAVNGEVQDNPDNDNSFTPSAEHASSELTCRAYADDQDDGISAWSIEVAAQITE